MISPVRRNSVVWHCFVTNTHTHTQIYIDMRVENREIEYADIESAKLRLRERYL